MPGVGKGKESRQGARAEARVLRGREVQGAPEERGERRGTGGRRRHRRARYVCRAGEPLSRKGVPISGSNTRKDDEHEQGNFERAIETAGEHGPELKHKYVALQATNFIRDGKPELAVKLYRRHSAPPYEQVGKLVGQYSVQRAAVLCGCGSSLRCGGSVIQ